MDKIYRAQSAEKSERVPDILEINGFGGEKQANKIDYKQLVSALPKPFREKLTAGFDMKKFAKIFEDEEMMRTADAFFACGMNISLTARVLYMHRNTLIYRLGTIKRYTGLDLKDFESAVNFKLLHYLYLIK